MVMFLIVDDMSYILMDFHSHSDSTQGDSVGSWCEHKHGLHGDHGIIGAATELLVVTGVDLASVQLLVGRQTTTRRPAVVNDQSPLSTSAFSPCRVCRQ